MDRYTGQTAYNTVCNGSCNNFVCAYKFSFVVHTKLAAEFSIVFVVLPTTSAALKFAAPDNTGFVLPVQNY